MWWREAWRLFMAAPWAWIVVVVLMAVVEWMLNRAFVRQRGIGTLIELLAYPLYTMVVLRLAYILDEHEPISIGALVSGPYLSLFVAMLVTGLLCALAVAAAALFAGLFVAGGFKALLAARAANALMSLGGVVIVATLLALLLMLPVMMMMWFAPTLIMFRDEGPLSALGTSFRACLHNTPALLVYGLLGLVFAIVATLPFGIGWIVLAPVTLATLYTSYESIFEKSD